MPDPLGCGIMTTVIIIYPHDDMYHGMCKCPHHKMIPAFITLIGLLFLANGLGKLSDGTLAWSWPLALVLIGLQKMFGSMCKCCGAGAMKSCCKDGGKDGECCKEGGDGGACCKDGGKECSCK